ADQPPRAAAEPIASRRRDRDKSPSKLRARRNESMYRPRSPLLFGPLLQPRRAALYRAYYANVPPLLRSARRLRELRFAEEKRPKHSRSIKRVEAKGKRNGSRKVTKQRFSSFVSGRTESRPG